MLIMGFRRILYLWILGSPKPYKASNHVAEIVRNFWEHSCTLSPQLLVGLVLWKGSDYLIVVTSVEDHHCVTTVSYNSKVSTGHYELKTPSSCSNQIVLGLRRTLQDLDSLNFLLWQDSYRLLHLAERSCARHWRVEPLVSFNGMLLKMTTVFLLSHSRRQVLRLICRCWILQQCLVLLPATTHQTFFN